jgi:tetratricopeptide (TPR) repeat protein
VSGATLERRLANYRASVRPTARTDADRSRSATLANLMAEAVDGEIVGSELGAVVRCEPLTVVLPLDRERLSRIPGQPPPDVPLVCIDTETTGLATAAGTMAFLVGLGWWEGDRFRQAQLLLPDQPNEPALLELLEAHIPRTSWLVTYNGRGFDWPLLVARYRMARRDPPVHAGHLDLLPFVRRVFKHRMSDARLRTVESELLGVARHEDVDGWEIPGRYLDFLRSGLAAPLLAVVRHNREDVRSLARLLVHVEAQFSDAAGRRLAHRGDLAGLARAYSRERRLDEALDCLETAVAMSSPPLGVPAASAARDPVPDDELWWTPRRPVDYGGRAVRSQTAPPRLDSPWTEERILVERARLLRRLGRYEAAADAWAGLAAGIGPFALVAWIEIAKLREHRLGDLPGAFAAVDRALALAERRRRLGRVDPAVDMALARRLERLARRLDARGARAALVS